MTRTVTLPYIGSPLIVPLSLRPFAEIAGSVPREPVPPAMPPLNAAAPEDLPDIVTGSSINGAASLFAQPRAFGNNRPKRPSVYNGAFTMLTGNSAWNARPFSFSGSAAPVPSYSDLALGLAAGGPLRFRGW